MKFIFLLLANMLILSLLITAQPLLQKDMEEDDPYQKKNYFLVGVNYLSNNVYLGRKDTMVIPYTSPYIGYHFKNGIYGKAMAAYTSAGSQGGHIDLATIEGGYDHDFGKNINAGINAERFFYNKNSISVKANTVACVGIDAQYTNEWIEPSMQFDMNFNKNTQDYVLGSSIDHNFSFDKSRLEVLPTLTLFAGTQNYYDEYFTNRINKKDKTVKVKHIVANATQFNALDYEISLKTSYRIDNWVFILRPVWAIPLNPSIITLPKNKSQTEKLSDSFFVEFDICFRG